MNCQDCEKIGGKCLACFKWDIQTGALYVKDVAAAVESLAKWKIEPKYHEGHECCPKCVFQIARLREELAQAKKIMDVAGDYQKWKAREEQISTLTAANEELRRKLAIDWEQVEDARNLALSLAAENESLKKKLVESENQKDTLCRDRDYAISRRETVEAANSRMAEAAKDLIDEAERVYYAAIEDGRKLIHFGRAIERMKAALNSPEKAGEEKPCQRCSGTREIQVECWRKDDCPNKKMPHYLRCPDCALPAASGTEKKDMPEQWLTPDGACAKCGTVDLHKAECDFGPTKSAPEKKPWAAK